MATAETIDAARASLQRVQDFDSKSIARQADLGRLDFSEAVPMAESVVDLFQRINPNTLSVFSQSQINHIRGHADSAYNTLSKFLSFDPATSSNVAEERRSLISELSSIRDNFTDALTSVISLSVVSSLDPSTTRHEMRAIIQRFEDEKNAALAEVEKLGHDATEILARVREAAAEQGVSTQASHFGNLADGHVTEAATWLRNSVIAGGLLLGFALATSFTYRIEYLAPKNPVEAVQLITSKLVILGILSYGVIVCVRNFLSHKHNVVVNRHRQNALLTYTAFVDAAPSNASREIVLTHAASSVFSPQETGYVRHEEPASAKSIMEILTKAPLADKSA